MLLLPLNIKDKKRLTVECQFFGTISHFGYVAKSVLCKH
ncbi:hypothetical protein A6A12_0180 [Vibrio anguillarum]|nr:hypothetical protein A6A12_0180 [Vibrio anguillarum]